MNAIVPVAMPLQDMQTLAVAIAKSELFGIKTPEQALVLMAIAQAEGRHPVEAARDYDIISGGPPRRPRRCCAISSWPAARSSGTA